MKKALFAALFLILSVGLFAQQIESGVFEVNYNTKGFTLHENDGTRIITQEVRFKTPFETIPSVVCGINKLDGDKDKNLRIDVAATAISRDGFVLRIKTWGDSKIFEVGGSWVAHN